MSRTIKAIERHMTLPSKKREARLSLALRNSSENGNSADRKHSLDVCAQKIALGFRAFAINQTRNS